MKKKFFSMLMIVAASVSLSGLAFAHCGMCGKDGKDGMVHEHEGKKECALTDDKKECSLKKSDKEHQKGCAMPCCSKAKTNFGPKKR